MKVFVFVAIALCACAAIANGATVLRDDDRTWMGANFDTFKTLFGLTDQQMEDRQMLDDGVFDISGANNQPAQMIPTPWLLAANVAGAAACGASNQNGIYTTINYAFGACPNVQAAGNAIDNKWLQTPVFDCGTDSNGQPLGLRNVGKAVWALAGPSERAAIFPAVDHGPFPQEAIESTVYLSNSPTGPWQQAEVKKVYLEGRSTAFNYDAFVYVVGLPQEGQTFNFVSIVATGPGSLNEKCGSDDEIDGVIGVNLSNAVVPSSECSPITQSYSQYINGQTVTSVADAHCGCIYWLP